MSERTVKGHVSSLLDKLGLSRRTEVAFIAAKWRIRSSEDRGCE